MALLNIDDIRIEFPSRRGTMVAVDGVSLSLEKARSWAWWANPAPASPPSATP